ncbi:MULTISPECIES: cation diffusion facilitator family transporter [unclassified Coleofasciculus]|uniref:cation diffusion facilitator family transporter n=1 Tax=unclassified Coleofasciculus TaxID=2692782 RepID=UPI0018811D43|nr:MULTISPECIES: cation diffusion facilitator family transporter [unclassified Coleofasciculus]MBE9125425.1 cation transporter [Coleofasciculus sp. LEGE 07081]MBE9147111.1 cation transporter [Coleofasciculus sp. LEGE 07092]
MVNDHGHEHAPTNYNRAFAIGTALNLGFVIIEALFGFLTQSLALLADAGHNLSDVLGLLLAWGANILAQHPPTKHYTYGLGRSSILAALLNAIVLILVMGGIAWEAIRRFVNPSPVPGITIIVVAAVGVVINTVTALLFMSGRKEDLNIRGAFLHMAADALVSVGVVLAGVAILTTGWLWFDPIVSLIIVVVVVVGTWQLLRDSLRLALDAVPAGIEPQAVRTYLTERPGVAQVHDLHIWAMSTTETALTAHLVMPQGYPGDAFLTETVKELHDHFGVEHATLQVEIGDPNHPCRLESKHRV